MIKATAGDTIEIPYTLASYPSSDWTLTAYFVGPSVLTIVATAEDDGSYLITIPATQSSGLKAGLYDANLRVTDGTTVVTATILRVNILPNPAVSAARVTLAARMIELIEKALLNQLTAGEAIESLSISGRSLSMINRQELISERARWARELARLNNPTATTGVRQIALQTGRL